MGLLDSAFRCVISTSFGDIFYNNCFKIGILPIRITQDARGKLFDDAERGANATLTIDLASQEIRGPDAHGQIRDRPVPQALPDERPRPILGLTMEKKAATTLRGEGQHALGLAPREPSC